MSTLKTLSLERWQYWLSLKTWSAHEAVAVLLGIDPEGCDHQAVQAAFESDEMPRLERHFVRDGLMAFSMLEKPEQPGRFESSNERHSPAEWLDSFRKFGELPYQPQAGAAGDDAELNTKSRNVMLRILGGLVLANYKGGIHGRVEPLMSVLADLQTVGIEVSERALRNYLKEAAELIEKPPKS